MKNIHKLITQNNLILYLAIVVNIVLIVNSYLICREVIRQKRDELYAVNFEGEIVPLSWVERRDKIAVEIKNHLQIFVHRFYSFNEYNFEQRANLALEIADVEDLYILRCNKRVYENTTMFHLSHEAILLPEHITIVEDQDEWSVEFEFTSRCLGADGIVSDIKQYSCSGKLRFTTRNFPNNPHGIFIYNFMEREIPLKDE